MSPPRVAIARDHDIVAAGFAALLRPYADRVAVVELDDVSEAAGRVDLLLLDPSCETAAQVDISALVDRGVTVVVFTWHPGSAATATALSAGAVGSIWKGAGADQLVELITHAAGGSTLSASEVEDERFDESATWLGAEAGLSRGESAVLALIVRGFSNQEIAEQRYVTVNTIKSTVRPLYRKIDVTRRSQAIAWAIQHGFQTSVPDDSAVLRARWMRTP
ncbi:MAG: liaR 1 [Aeromicrobium sp.]|nr:liaR 1 [Aeromicrobium sp.]